MSQPTQTRNARFTAAFVRGVIWAVLAISLLVGAVTLATGAVTTVDSIASNSIRLSLVAEQTLPAAADRGESHIVEGAYETAGVLVTDLPVGIAALASAASIVQILTQVAVAACGALLAWRLLRKQLFRRSLSITVTLAGAALLTGGIFSQGFGSLAAAMAAGDLNGGQHPGFWPIAGRIDGTTLFFGLVLLLVGLAFEYGERLQRDTEGLV
jgi:hypothetical protein